MLAAALSLAAVACLTVAIADMVRGHDDGPRGWVLRALAVVCFAAAVALTARR